MLVAVYRCLYGEDFIQESIRSILPHVDRIAVVIAPRPWGASAGVTYRGLYYGWPAKFDDLRERVLELQEPKIEIIDDFYPTPFGQHDHLVQNVLALLGYLPADIMFIEPDHVFEDGEAARTFARWRASSSPVGATSQIEWWAPPGYKPEWRVPERPARASVLFYRDVPAGKKLPPTYPVEVVGEVHNLGFCMSEKVMFLKHLTAIAFSSEIADCAPNVDWFEQKWLGWHPWENNHNLEITATLEHLIPRALPCDLQLLPASIRKRYEERPCL